MLERAYRTAKEQDAEVVVWDADQYDEKGGLLTDLRGSIRWEQLPEKAPINRRTIFGNRFLAFCGWAWDKLFRMEHIRALGLCFQEIPAINDMSFVFTALMLAERIDVVRKIGTHYRTRTGMSISDRRWKYWDCGYLALLKLGKLLRQHNIFEEVKRDYISYSLEFSVQYYDTVEGEARDLLYDKLCGSWFRDLGIVELSEEAFDCTVEYRRYRNMMLLYRHGLRWHDPEAEEFREIFEENETLRERTKTQEAEIQRLQSSFSWRIGRAVTWAPRMMRRQLS